METYVVMATHNVINSQLFMDGPKGFFANDQAVDYRPVVDESPYSEVVPRARGGRG